MDNKLIEKKPLIKWGWVRAVLFFLGGFGVMAVYRPTRNFLLQENGISSGLEYLLMARSLKLLFFLLLIFLVRKFIDRKSFLSIGFSLRQTYRKDLLIGLILGIGMVAIIFLFLLSMGLIEIREINFPFYELALLTGIMLVVAIMEELLYRLYLLTNLMLSMNKYIALTVTCVLFTLIHADNSDVTILALVNIFLAAVFLGIYYIHMKNVWFPIMVHFGWNVGIGPIFGSAISGNEVAGILVIDSIGSDFLTGGAFGFEGSIITTVVYILAIVLVHFKYRNTSVENLLYTRNNSIDVGNNSSEVGHHVLKKPIPRFKKTATHITAIVLIQQMTIVVI